MSTNAMINKLLHDEWAKNKKREIDPQTKKPYTEIWENSGDTEYDKQVLEFAQNGQLPSYVKIDNQQVKIDVLNMPFEELPSKFQNGNKEVGLTAEEILGNSNGTWIDYINKFEKTFGVKPTALKFSNKSIQFDDKKIEEYAEEIHDGWVRQKFEELRHNPDAEIDDNLIVPYEDLPKEEQLKLKSHAVLAMEVVSAVNKGKELDYLLDRAYGDKPVFDKNGKENYASNMMMGSVLHGKLAKFTPDEIEIMEGFFNEKSDALRFAKNRMVKEENKPIFENNNNSTTLTSTKEDKEISNN